MTLADADNNALLHAARDNGCADDAEGKPLRRNMFFSYSGFGGGKRSGCCEIVLIMSSRFVALSVSLTRKVSLSDNFCDRINDPPDVAATVAAVSSRAAARIAQGNALEAERFRVVRAALAAVGRRDVESFREQLAVLHPAEEDQ